MAREQKGGRHNNGPAADQALSAGSSVIENPQTKTGAEGELSPWVLFLKNRRAARDQKTAAAVDVRSRATRTDIDRYWDTHGLLWAGFAFASGILIYSLLPAEPEPYVLAAVFAAIAAPKCLAARRRGMSKPWVLALAVVAGLGLTALRTAMVDAPRLAEPMTVLLRGEVQSSEERRSGKRLLVKPIAINGVAAKRLGFVERVRLRVPPDTLVAPGDWVEVRARLFPPMGPVVPGGYDFSFRGFFMKIGATGFSYGEPIRIAGPPTRWSMTAKRQIDQLRQNLAQRISESLPEGPETALAIALLVGDRSQISKETEDSLRAAGIAHILAISGLHMALFAGGAYAVVLGALALIPGLALRWPLHKVSALLALGAALFYLLLSGASVATQRSFIMITLVFMGVVFGRRGLTLRSVAIAGLVLLILAPERLFYPGFQMSFAAVIALVAVYDHWRSLEHQRGYASLGQTTGSRLARTGAKWAAGLFVTALVAGTATGIVGAYHFSRIAPFGIVGNMLGMPVFSFLVMPMGVLALALMPFGLSVIPLKVMSLGLSLMIKVAEFTEGLSPAGGLIGSLSAPAAILLMSGGFFGLLAPGQWRLWAAVPFALGISLAIISRPPDIYFPSNGNQLAARDQVGILRIAPARSSFPAELWLEREGVDASSLKTRKMGKDQRTCDPLGCIIRAHAKSTKSQEGQVPPILIAYPKETEALLEDCRFADIVVSDKIAPSECGADLIIDRNVRKYRGAISVWLALEENTGGQSGQKTPRKPVIDHISYGKTKPPRPWHRPGTVTRQSVRKAK